MTRLARALGVVAVALAAAIALPSPAHAHDDEVALFVEPQTASPGVSIVVRADLPTTSPVSLELVGGHGQRLALTTVRDPGQGHFEVVVAVPASATAGAWRLEARSAGSLLAGRELRITPAPARAGPGEQADQAEPVAAPPGSGLTPIRPDAAGLSARAASERAVSGRQAGGPWLISPWLWAGVAASLAGIAGAARTARRLRTQPAGASSPPT